MLAFVASDVCRQVSWYVGGVIAAESSTSEKRALNFSNCHRLFLFNSVDLIIRLLNIY